MRLRSIVLVVAAVAMVCGGFISAASATTSPAVNSRNGVSSRFLRGEVAEIDDDDDAEERALPSLSMPSFDDFMKNTPITAKALKTAKGKKLPEWMGYNVKEWYVRGKVNTVMRQIEEKGWNPQTLGDYLKITEKAELMKYGDLMKDADYMLWRHFLKYWAKRHPSKAN